MELEVVNKKILMPQREDGCCSHEHEHHHDGCCGHEHEHHHDGCCGHEHEHHHDEDCCGHEHEHHHHHDGCCCEHDHHHGGGCSCGHEHHTEGGKLFVGELVVGALLFVVAMFTNVLPEQLELPVLVVAYVILGWRVLWSAAKGVARGDAFDENFLMSIATLGAFAVQAWEEAVGVMLFCRLGELFEHRAAEKSRQQIMEAVDLRPEKVNLVVGNEVKTIAATGAKVGDVLIVRVGERIPLDAVVLEGNSFVDTSPITGEPVPLRRQAGDEVISGCINTTEMLKVRVTKLLHESMVSKILASVENAAESKPAMDRFITRFAKVYTPIVVVLALATAVIPSLVTGDWQKWVYTAMTFLVISCPCALVLSVPLSYFAGVGTGSKYGILFKGAVTMDVIKTIKVVALDKTGTLTKGNFVLQKVLPKNIAEEELLALCAAAEQGSNHPLAKSIVTAAEERGLSLVQPESFKEIAGEGLEAQVGQDVVLCGNEKLLARHHVRIIASEALGGSEVLVARNGEYLGKLVVNDTLKADTVASLAKLKQMGVKTVLLTGDIQSEAERVAKLTGVDEVRAGLLPQDKLSALKELRQAYGAIGFVGDGINDAPVLAGADVGMAMGSGADAAMEAADVVFMNSDMDSLPKAFKLAKTTAAIAWQNVVLALGSKIAIMVLGLCGYASMWAAVFADTGVALLCVLNAVRILYKKL